jgi:hypothetical protein
MNTCIMSQGRIIEICSSSIILHFKKVYFRICDKGYRGFNVTLVSGRRLMLITVYVDGFVGYTVPKIRFKNIPRNETAGLRFQFLHSCICK